MFSRIERLLIALMFALLAAGVTLIAAQAQHNSPPPQDQSSNCAVCHTEFQTSWMSGPHGHAVDDPVFVEEWTTQGKPGACLVCHVTGYDPATATWKADGVTCEACHGEGPSDHPKSPMPIDRSTDLCGRCHSDTRFGWQEWKISTHYQRGMDCTVCHDPHSASLKQVASARGQAPTYADASELCITCHNEYSMDFPYSSHHQKGVSCVDCHVNHLENDDRTTHSVPDHSFNASLKSCNTCHAEQMHQPGMALETETSTSAPTSEEIPPKILELTSVTPDPSPVSPFGFAGLAALIGLAAGMVLAPWLERFYHRAVKNEDEETQND
jgi:predicted CXXCH cytochrome family protein